MKASLDIKLAFLMDGSNFWTTQFKEPVNNMLGTILIMVPQKNLKLFKFVHQTMSDNKLGQVKIEEYDMSNVKMPTLDN
ncbi:hypothetical protein VIBNISFn118_1300036 [Vibrio nigripulchritudo SFn118]|nr:hypothetical protein VIBNISFn118_1300036 [Vibrio nigripulchritudo SFn118]